MLFENKGDNRTVHKTNDLPTVEIKDYNVMIDGQNFFNQPVKNNFRTYDNIQKIATVKEMITLLAVYEIIIISIITIKR